MACTRMLTSSNSDSNDSQSGFLGSIGQEQPIVAKPSSIPWINLEYRDRNAAGESLEEKGS